MNLGHRGTTAEVKALLRDHPGKVCTWGVQATPQGHCVTVYDTCKRIIAQRTYPHDERDLAIEWGARKALTLRKAAGQ